jgi:outer membrane immunogenic protein
MKTILLAALALATALCSAPALAGDPTATDWSGFYLGVNGGYGLGHFDVVTASAIPDLDGITRGYGANGGLFGATAGFNVETGNVVFGLEGDADWARLSGTAAPIKPNNSPASVLTSNINWLATLRGRVGFNEDNLLFFATGLAAGGVNGTVTNFPSGSTTSTIGGTQYGYAAGIGLEAAVTDHVSVKAEFLHVDLGTTKYALPPIDANAHPTANILRVGVNYRF